MKAWVRQCTPHSSRTELKTGEPDGISVLRATGIVLKSRQDKHFKLGMYINKILQIIVVKC